MSLINLLVKHSSKPYNPDIANAFFRVGYVESWGRGITKMRIECEKAKLPVPTYKYEASDFWIEFRKDIYNELYFQQFNLNQRQLKAMMFVKDKGEITNKIYQELCDTSKATVTRDLSELVDKHKFLERIGDVGAGTVYKLIGSIGS